MNPRSQEARQAEGRILAMERPVHVPGGLPGPSRDFRHAWGGADRRGRGRRRGSVEAYEKLKRLVAEVEEDLRKAEGGNKAAGTRVRQTMQDIKGAAQEIREAILSLRGKGEEGEAKK